MLTIIRPIIDDAIAGLFDAEVVGAVSVNSLVQDLVLAEASLRAFSTRWNKI